MKHTYWIILLILFAAHLSFRFYDIENRNLFGFDQVDNAWAAKNIIVDHRFPLVGVPVKQNTGFYLGPAYYYLLTPIYWLFNLDPIASGIFAGVTSIFTFFTLFFIIKKLFSTHIALIAIFIHTVSLFIVNADRFQWNVNFITPVSLIIFYCLYRVLNGGLKYILPLALTLGFSFSIHFTAIFFIPIILCTLPFFPKNIQVIKYVLFSIPLFLIWFIPTFISEVSSKAASSKSLISYLDTYYHGLHARRVLQLLADAFIEFEQVLGRMFKPLQYIVLPIFIFLYLRPIGGEKFILSYLVLLWIIIPWIGFSTYSGEISNYYFSMTRPVVIITLSFITWRLLISKFMLLKFLILLFWAYYTITNISMFFEPVYRPLSYHRAQVKQAINKGEVIEFSQFSPQAYIYYVYKRNENIAETNKK